MKAAAHLATSVDNDPRRCWRARICNWADLQMALIQEQFVVNDHPKILHCGPERNIAVSNLQQNAINLLHLESRAHQNYLRFLRVQAQSVLQEPTL